MKGMITILSKILDAILAIDENMGGNCGKHWKGQVLR